MAPSLIVMVREAVVVSATHGCLLDRARWQYFLLFEVGMKYRVIQ